MGKLRIRRKRRRDIWKPDAAIAILSVMVVALLFLWGGLYWNESSKGNLAVQAYEGELAEFSYPEDESLDSLDQAEPAASESSTEDGRTASESESSGPADPPDGQSAAAGEEPPSSSAPDGEAVPSPSASSGIGNAPGGAEGAKSSKAAGNDKPGAMAGDKPSTAGSEKPDATGSDKPGATADEKPNAAGSEKPDATDSDKPSATAGDKPIATGSDKPNEAGIAEPTEPAAESPADTDSESPSANPEETAVSRTQKYEQEIAEVQAACTRKMREVTSGAESAFQQLNKLDPIAVQAWQAGFANELEDAESDCDGQFRAIVQSAESDSESPAAIEEWQRTFVSMKQELKAESNAKAKQLLGG